VVVRHEDTSFFVVLVMYGYRHAYRGAAAAGFNIKVAADELHSLVHAGDANPESEGDSAFRLRRFPEIRCPCRLFLV